MVGFTGVRDFPNTELPDLAGLLQVCESCRKLVICGGESDAIDDVNDSMLDVLCPIRFDYDNLCFITVYRNTCLGHSVKYLRLQK